LSPGRSTTRSCATATTRSTTAPSTASLSGRSPVTGTRGWIQSQVKETRQPEAGHPLQAIGLRARFVSESRCFLRHAPYSAELASCREISA
jgi:hypothetical protein